MEVLSAGASRPFSGREPSLTFWAFRAQHDIVGFGPALVGGLSSRMQHFVGQASIAAPALGPGSTPAGIVEADPAGGSGSDVFPAGYVVL